MEISFVEFDIEDGSVPADRLFEERLFDVLLDGKPITDPEYRLLTAKECAKYLGVSESCFYRLRKRFPDMPYRSRYNGLDPYHEGRRYYWRYYYGREVKNFLQYRFY